MLNKSSRLMGKPHFYRFMQVTKAVSSALVSTEFGPICLSSGLLPTSLSRNVVLGTPNALAAALQDMCPSLFSLIADSIDLTEYV